jgi:hypothetical protein
MYRSNLSVSDHLIDALFHGGSTASDIGNFKNGTDSPGNLL